MNAKPKWRRGPVEVAFRKRLAKAYLREGWAVHRSIDHATGWTVTHQRSGMAAAYLKRLTDAKLFVNHLIEIGLTDPDAANATQYAVIRRAFFLKYTETVQCLYP